MYKKFVCVEYFLMSTVVEKKVYKVFLLLPVVILPMNYCASTHRPLSGGWSPKTVWDGTALCFILKDCA